MKVELPRAVFAQISLYSKLKVWSKYFTAHSSPSPSLPVLIWFNHLLLILIFLFLLCKCFCRYRRILGFSSLGNSAKHLSSTDNSLWMEGIPPCFALEIFRMAFIPLLRKKGKGFGLIYFEIETLVSLKILLVVETLWSWQLQHVITAWHFVLWQVFL